MKLSHREQNGVVVLEPRGKIMGGPEATQLLDSLHEFIQSDKRKVIIDLGKVDWMNSTGLGILIKAMQSLKDNDGQLKLANVTEKISSLLTITKLATVFETYDSVEDAVGAFSA